MFEEGDIKHQQLCELWLGGVRVLRGPTVAEREGGGKNRQL